MPDFISIGQMDFLFYVGLIGNLEGSEACLLAIITGIRYLLVLNSMLLPELYGSDLNSELLFTQVLHSFATDFKLIVINWACICQTMSTN